MSRGTRSAHPPSSFAWQRRERPLPSSHRMSACAWPARGGAWSVFAHQPAHPLRCASPRAASPSALAMKRRGFEHPANVGPHRGAAPIGPRRTQCRRPCRLPPRIHTGAGAVPPRQTRCTPYARRVEIDWAPLIASTSAGPKGRPASIWSTFLRTVTRSPDIIPIGRCGSDLPPVVVPVLMRELSS